VKPRHRAILRELLAQPTAPFAESAVVEVVRRWADRRGVCFRRDRAGNVLLHHERRGSSAGGHWLFAAHMDHPGFIACRQRGRDLWAEFRGGMARRYFRGGRVRFFSPEGEVLAEVRSVAKAADGPWLACRLRLGRAAEVPAGTVGMWDLPAMAVAGKVLSSRACDDVVGTAAVICAVDEIVSRPLPVRVTALLTRAEEAAFVGCLAACRLGSIPRDAFIVAVETSAAQPAAPLGSGVVVRVGDKTRTFDPSLTAHISAVAAELAKRDRRFGFNRQLMPGGTCESTAYAIFGHAAAGLCVPLGNYHNQGPRGRVAPEKVHTDDFSSLVKLLVAVALERRRPEQTDAALKRRLAGLLRARGKYL